MLTYEEELKVLELKKLTAVRVMIKDKDEVPWLIDRLLEINEECYKVWKELQEANQELARRAEFD